MKIGTAFQTKILIHHSWFWLLPLSIGALVLLNIEPLIEASIAGLLIFGSVLTATLLRLYMARRVGVNWTRVMLFPLGAVTEREQRSTSPQQMKIAAAELSIYAMLAIIFGWLWSRLPMNALGLEMEIVALFNLGIFLFMLLLRLSPYHDNLLYAVLSRILPANGAWRVMSGLNSLALGVFAVTGLFAIRSSWWAFGLWFAVALTVSQMVEAAEQMGEYRDEAEFEQVKSYSVVSQPASIVNS